MNTKTPCPSVHVLRMYTAGRLVGGEVDAVRAHLAGCTRCRGVVEGLEATAKDPRPADEAGVWSETAMDATAPVDGDATGSMGTPATEPAPESEISALDLSFLDPPRRPDALGRIGEYDVLGLLGRGGMGVVLKGYDAALHRVVAVKVLEPRLAASRHARKRFLHEARSAAAINHPNVVTIHAVGVHGTMPYLVMECIPGQSLRERIHAGPRLAPSDVLRISLQIASGLAAAHAQGVIHRDIKPANIMLEDNVERVKITDFGLALAALNLSEMTSLEQIVGTPAYMSPEQVRGKVLDPRSDLFSLGCVMYAMVAGHSPFQGAHTLDIIGKVAEHHPPALREIDPSVPRALSDLVARLLAKAPGDRPGSAAAVAEAIRRQLAAANLEPPAVAEVTATVPLAHLRRKRRRKLLVDLLGGVAALALTVAILALALVYLRQAPDDLLARTRPDPPPPPAAGVAPIPVPAPPAPAALPPAGQVLVVEPAAEPGASPLRRAVARAGPRATLILRPGRYREPILLDDPDRLEGLTLRAEPGAVLTAPGRHNAVLTVDGVPGVTLSGLEFESGAPQFALAVKGDVPGLLVDGARFRKPTEAPAVGHWSHVLVAVHATGTPEAPIRFRGCTFGPWPTGLVLQGTYGPVAHVAVERCRFQGIALRALELIAPVRDVRIAGCLFVDGDVGLRLDALGLTGDSARITVTNNSFSGIRLWVDPAGCQPGLEGLVLVNNAIFAPGILDGEDGELAALRAEGWRIDHNLVEGDAAGVVSPLALRVPDLAVSTRDPDSPDFLRPRPGSPLGLFGAGGALPRHVGAVPPDPDDR